MGLLSVLSLAHRWVSERVSTGDIVIDATAGNGVDTLFLAEAVGPRGTVYAFDIQAQAIANTRHRLETVLGPKGTLPHLNLLQQSHDTLLQVLPPEQHGKVAAVLFNLGYLPDPAADHSLITKPDTTLEALHAALALLRPGGILTIVVYPGHPGGDEEADAVDSWASSLPSAIAQAAVYRMMQKPQAPYLIAVEKRKQSKTN
ncbi:class I SAM-dependent methyltransferase [Paenibacillus abyssi]|uniref:SAM-dependent methyltransferase n=1 Tax=Paenibacillus abyssi TaxID=1340531 RepID=A0A917FUU2_9BACL|nr:class I SAM-dependent methyltransferase [Paenibacillus abyssi]GGG04626.1 SAM-dependent methyltransferase [Paenibacillus abyssi]